MYVGYRYASLSIKWNSIILDDACPWKSDQIFHRGQEGGVINNLESTSQASL